MEKKRFSVGPAGVTAEDFRTPKTYTFIYIFIFLGIFLLLSSVYLSYNQTNPLSTGFSYVSSGITNLGQVFYASIVGRAIDETPVADAPAPTSSDTPQPAAPAESSPAETTTPATIIEVPATQDQAAVPIAENIILEPPAPPATPEPNTTPSTPASQENQSQTIPEGNTTGANTTGLNPATETIGVAIGVVNEIVSSVENTTQNPINQTALTETLNETNIANETITAENLSANINTKTTTKQYSAVIGKPVKWTKKVQIEKTTLPEESAAANIQVELPSSAGDIVVTKVDASTGNSQDITQNAVIQNEKNPAEVQPIKTVTGNVIVNSDSSGNGIITRISTFFSDIFNSFIGLTGRAVSDSSGTSENVSVNVNEQVANNDSVVVEYYTDAPYSEEKIVNNQEKQVTIVGPDIVHYQDVLAYSALPSEVKDASKIKLYWTSSDSGNKESINFEAQDTNGNGLIDTIQWVVPHLSNQTYEIILITKAVHLDSNKTLISDIYDFVKAQDNNWSEVIPAGDYVRATFEIPLNNKRDITVYARSADGNPTSIEVYTENSNEKIATIENVSSEGTYRNLLTALPDNQSYSTFDLKSVGGSIEYDHIVDPNYPTNMTALIVTCPGGCTPDITGNYTIFAMHFGNVAYKRTDGVYMIFDDTDTPNSQYAIYNSYGPPNTPPDPYFYGPSGIGVISPIGTYTANPGNSGSPVVSWGNVSNYTIYDCGNITQAGTYTLNQSITAAGGIPFCLNISADNVTLDGNGFKITGNFGGDESGIGISSTNVTVKNFLNISGFNYGVKITGNSNSIIDNTISSNIAESLRLEGNSNIIYGNNLAGNVNNNAINLIGNSNIIENNSILNNNKGIYITANAEYNQLINNIISGSVTGQSIARETWQFSNYLIYNNSFGEIRWTDETFIGSVSVDGNLAVTGDLTFPGNVIIANNSAYVNSDAFIGEKINSSANITLYGIGNRGYIVPAILKDGVICNDTSSQPCHNFTSLTASTVVFNVSSWSNYTIGEGYSTNLTACGTLSHANLVYTLMNDLATVGTCFTITADNVTLDGNGHSVNGSNLGDDYGVYASGGRTNLTVKNFKSIFFFSNGVRGELMNMSFILNNTVSSSGGDGLILAGYNITVSGNMISNANNGILFQFPSSNEIISNNNITNSVNRGIVLFGIGNNLVLNNNLLNNSINAIFTTSSTNNLLIYNNSNGEIRWTGSSFLDSLTVSGDLVFGSTINITNGSITVAPSLLTANPSLNLTVNITFTNTGYHGQYPALIHKMKKGSSRCIDCYNFTALDAATIIINVSNFGDGTISVGKSVVSQNNVSMGSGWNLVSLEMQNNDTGTSRNVTIVPGWNLIGYSSDVNESHTNINFTNATATMTMAQASQRGYVQKYFGYIANSDSSNSKYKYVPKDDSALTKEKGYWVYANTGVSGNLTLAGVGGSPKNESYKWTDLTFMNSSGTELNITDAGSSGWINQSLIFFYDSNAEAFAPILSTASSWQGYFIYGLKNNITLLRQN